MAYTSPVLIINSKSKTLLDLSLFHTALLLFYRSYLSNKQLIESFIHTVRDQNKYVTPFYMLIMT